MQVFVDTNVLLRVAQPENKLHTAAVSSLKRLKEQEYILAISPQVLFEYYVVATRPIARNGLALLLDEAIRDVTMLRSQFSLVLDRFSTISIWMELARSHSTTPSLAHDLHIVASMLSNDIKHILTFNEKDFCFYDQITVVNPLAVEETAVEAQ